MMLVAARFIAHRTRQCPRRLTAITAFRTIYTPARLSQKVHIPPKSILLVNKLRTKPVVDAISAILSYLKEQHPQVRVFHEDRKDRPGGVEPWRPGADSEKIDLVVTLGGDGTILHAASLFKASEVPPVLSFSMGTLGFLLPFHIDDFAKALETAFAGKATVLQRMRLSCSFQRKDGSDKDAEPWQVMNEVALHRGASPHLNTIDIYVDGQHLTEAVSDGIIVSTPTGSTAYSLSAGGPIVHPSLSAIVLTPICPRSLSFRPLVFPSSSTIVLRVSERTRAEAGLSMDGAVSYHLGPGESVTVQASMYPVPCINRSSIAEPDDSRPFDELDVEHTHARLHSGGGIKGDVGESEKREAGMGMGIGIGGKEGAGPGKEDDWVRDINNLLQYNATFRSKALLRHSRT